LKDETHLVNLPQVIEGCRQFRRSSQHELYMTFYNYVMTIATRYAANTETAEEIVNDAFYKAFTKIDRYNEEVPFRFWLRRIAINTAIDRYRSNLHVLQTVELQTFHEEANDAGIVESLTREQILLLLAQVPPAYRTVFNLFVVDGFSHEEISETLGISVGASKSNLARARQHLKKLLSTESELMRRI
jgi:RNA polymerase sigma factor (sigma-70 family)